MKRLMIACLTVCLLCSMLTSAVQASGEETVITCENGANFKADDNWRPSGLKGEGETLSKYTINNGEPATAVYSANLPEGNYRVYFDNIVKGDNAPKIKITVGHDGGETALELVHNSGSGGYTDLGVYTVKKDIPITVTVERIAEKTMRIASVKFEKTTDAPGPSKSSNVSEENGAISDMPVSSGQVVIINVNDSGYLESEGWANSGLMAYNEKPSRYSPEDERDSYASFTAALAGKYHVYFHNIVNANGHDDPKISVEHAGGKNIVSYTGKKGTTGFIDLGVYEFSGEAPAVVTVMKTGRGCIRASAVKFEPTDDPLDAKSEALPVEDVPVPKVTYTLDETAPYDGIRVTINGKEQKYDQMPVIMNDRTLVPMRGIFEAMGAKIDWDGETSTVTAKTEEHEIVLTIGNKTAYADSVTVELDQEPVIINSRTMVPVRFVAESLDATVDWNGDEQLVEITKDNLKSAYKQIVLKDLGAKADGVTDDGPVIQQALDIAQENGGYATIVFENNKTYYIGARPDSWHYFVLENAEHIYFDGNGSELIFERTNGMFRLLNSEHITFDGLSFDLSMPNFFQGEIVAVDPDETTFTVKRSEGYPTPKTGDSNVSAGGGMHGIIYDKETGHKPSPSPYSLNPVKVEDLGDDTFKFTVDRSSQEAFGAAFAYVAVGQLYTIGLTGKDVPSEYSAQRVYYPMASFYVERCSEVEWKDTNLYGSLAMGMILVCNEGNLYFTNHAIRRKPGTDRMLSVPSDGIHARSNRGSLIFDNCYFEASGDDLFSPHHKDEKIEQQIEPTKFVLKSTAGDLLPTHAGDELIFFNRNTGEIYAVTHVKEVTPNEADKTNTVVVDTTVDLSEVKNKDAVFVMNMDLSAKGTTVRNTTFRTVHRNAILLRLSDVLIENCTFESIGGQAITAVGQANTGVVNHNLVIRNNRFVQTLWTALRIGSAIFNRHPHGYVTQNILVENNTFTVSEGYGINLTDGNRITIRGNQITILEDQWQSADLALKDDYAIRIYNGIDVVCEDNEIIVERSGTAPDGAICVENNGEDQPMFANNQFNLPKATKEILEK